MNHWQAGVLLKKAISLLLPGALHSHINRQSVVSALLGAGQHRIFTFSSGPITRAQTSSASAPGGGHGTGHHAGSGSASGAMRETPAASAAEVLPAVGRQHAAPPPPPPPHGHSPHSPGPDRDQPSLAAVLGAAFSVTRGILDAPTLGQLAFGLQALARKHSESRLLDHPEGATPLPGGAAQLQQLSLELLDALELSHGAYRSSGAGLAAMSCLRAQNVRVWRPQGGRLQPGYYIAVDHASKRLVWGVRGTRAFNDLLIDFAAAAHPLGPGHAHWGMTHAAHWLLRQESTRVAGLLASLPGYRLVLVGHSLGGAVAALVAFMIREGLGPGRDITAESISCYAFAPPAVMTEPLATACRSFVTSVVLGNDIVPRTNAASLRTLHAELQGIDWLAELRRTMSIDPHFLKGLSDPWGAIAWLASFAAAAPGKAADPWVAAAVQQLGASVLQSSGLQGALQTLAEWRARATASPVAGQAEAAVKRQAELVRAWLQDLSTASPGGGAHSSSAATMSSLSPPTMESAQRAAGAAVAHLRASLDAAVGGGVAAVNAATALAAAAMDRLPSMPSLPLAHELPLIAELQPPRLPPPAAATANAACATTVSGSCAVGTRNGHDATAAVAAGTLSQEAAGAAAAATSASGSRGDEDGDGDWRCRQSAAASASGSGVAAPPDPLRNMPQLLQPGRVLYIKREGMAAEARPRRRLRRLLSEPGRGASRDDSGSQPAGAMADPEASELGRAGTAPPTPGSSDSSSIRPAEAAGAATAVAAPAASAEAPGGSPPPHSVGCAGRYSVVELPPGGAFRRIVLSRTALSDHQCRAYRRVLEHLAQINAPPQ